MTDGWKYSGIFLGSLNFILGLLLAYHGIWVAGLCLFFAGLIFGYLLADAAINH